MKHLFRSFLLLLLAGAPALATVHTRSVSAKDIVNGYIVAQFPAADGAVSLSQPLYRPIDALPKGVTADAPEHFTVIKGTERGQRFMAVRIPAYSRRTDGGYQILTSFTLDVPEAAAAPAAKGSRIAASAKIAATTSPLASGTWYKIGVPARGVYKIDYAFLQSLGISGTVPSANIRLVGNGGAMLYESNLIPRPLDLTENALWMSDGGDGAFGSGDFFAFYAPGPVRWDKDSANARFLHTAHLYADSSYYFLSVDAGTGLRIADAPAVGNATATVSSFDDYAAHEADLYNPGHFGKEWWGEAFGSGTDALPARDFSFPLGSITDTLRVRMVAASRAFAAGTQMNALLNGKMIGAKAFGAVEDADDKTPVDPWYLEQTVPALGAATATFHLAYSSVQYGDIGYLNFIELNWRRPLAFAGGTFAFRDWRSVAPGAVAAYNLAGATAATQVWDITNPLQPARMAGNLSSNIFSFRQDASALHEFVALDGSNFSTPYSLGKVDNQNLHGADAPQFVIVTHPDFLSAANRLADFHRQHDGMRVLVATTQQVYNEFSSGAQDIGGIRDMMRYYYLTAGTDTSRMPRYLLLFGDASYDYKNRVASNTNFVPTYESNESINADNAFVVDDYFGFLDDNEDIGNFDTINTLELGIGRIPVTTVADAEAAVNKIIIYRSPASLGPWRVSNTFIGDNEDNAGTHLMDAEDANNVVSADMPFTNPFKIYLDNLPFVSTPGGERCPEANKGISDQIYKGTFLINYTGHGSTTTLAHERILTKEDFIQWKNINKLPIMVTATCDYARYDNPKQVSNGEGLIIKNDGGVIAMLTTTGPVYSNFNQEINDQYLRMQYLQRSNGSWPTFGDAIREGKNITYKVSNNSSELINFYRFTLLGDPALQPDFPKHRVRTDSITVLGGAPTDSMRALGAYTLTGHVEDVKGVLLPNFNGRAYVTIYDKPRVVNLITKETLAPRSYQMQDNVIFKGLTTVTNGRFSCSFIAPKDMNYEYGKGKVSYYAEDSITDGAGLDTGIVVGGFFDGADGDNDAPVVKPFIGDTLFRDGGLTGSNTLLYVQLSDRSGINVSGNGVGHDLTAVLDGDDANPYILNDYYQSEPNTYQRGHVSFPLAGLSDGAHTLKVKAWDVYNNSGEGTVHFVVGGSGFSIHNLHNYPNPFTNETHFFFEHNHPGEVLKAQIWIFNTSGQMIRLIEQTFTPSGSHSNELIWDGTDGHGALLPSGVYPYRLMLTTEKGISGTAYEKLVIIR